MNTTKTKISHTATPWRVGDAGNTIFGPKTENPSPETIARLDRTPNRQANAQHIVHCVNLHAELVEALKDCAASLDRLPDVDGAYRATCLQQARAILKKASEA